MSMLTNLLNCTLTASARHGMARDLKTMVHTTIRYT